MLAGRLCWLVLACWAVSIREQGWAWIAWRAFAQNSYCAGCIIAGVMEAADMSLRHAARIYEIVDTRENVCHWQQMAQSMGNAIGLVAAAGTRTQTPGTGT